MPEGELVVQLYDGAIGPTRLAQAQVRDSYSLGSPEKDLLPPGLSLYHSDVRSQQVNILQEPGEAVVPRAIYGLDCSCRHITRL